MPAVGGERSQVFGEPVEPFRRLTAAAGVDLGGEPVSPDVLALGEEDFPNLR